MCVFVYTSGNLCDPSLATASLYTSIASVIAKFSNIIFGNFPPAITGVRPCGCECVKFLIMGST